MYLRNKLIVMQNRIEIASSRKYIFSTVVVIVVGISVFLFCKNFEIKSKNTSSIEETLAFVDVKKDNQKEIVLADFNPNDLNLQQWQALGFTEKQAKTILKYKSVVGGGFTSKEQLKKCYSISDEKFQQLEPYLLLPEQFDRTEMTSIVYSKPFRNNEIKTLGKFNPNAYSLQDWVRLGFTEKQSMSILKYKNFLGGHFSSKQQLKDCFVISEDVYNRLAPYIMLPTVVSASVVDFEKEAKTHKRYRSFDPNTLDIDGWKALGFTDKQAQVIINYKTKILKGSFKNLDDVKSCFVISESKFTELKPYLLFNTESDEVLVNNNEVPKVQQQPESRQSIDFSKINLNSISFKQLKDFGFDDKAAASFIGFRNKLGGFVNTTQMLETYNIDRNLMEQLIKIAPPLNTDQVKKYTLVDAPEAWLKEHPYFKYSADRIIYYRISFPDERKIFKKLNTKPEYEARMKLYLN